MRRRGTVQLSGRASQRVKVQGPKSEFQATCPDCLSVNARDGAVSSQDSVLFGDCLVVSRETKRKPTILGDLIYPQKTHTIFLTNGNQKGQPFVWLPL